MLALVLISKLKVSPFHDPGMRAKRGDSVTAWHRGTIAMIIEWGAFAFMNPVLSVGGVTPYGGAGSDAGRSIEVDGDVVKGLPARRKSASAIIEGWQLVSLVYCVPLYHAIGTG
jgi:hypothetical protein